MSEVPHETLQAMVDVLIAMLCDTLEENNTWAKSGEIFDDPTVEKIRRHGMYGWVEADNGREYGKSIDLPHKQCPTSLIYIARYAGMGTEQFNQVLNGQRERPHQTKN